MVKIKPIYPYPALLLQTDQKYIIISDLHIGFESNLNARGINISSDTYVDEILNDLSSIINKEKPDTIILIGDIKNSVYTITKTEWENVQKFLQRLSEITKVFLVPGNHDGNIRHLVPRNVMMMSGKGMLLDDTLLTHGHTMPSNTSDSINRLIMGHIHPVFLKEGSVINGQRVWVYLKINKHDLFSNRKGILDIIVMPSFNKYFYNSIHDSHYKKSISPIIKKTIKNVSEGIVLTLDGSIVGDESSLEQVIYEAP
ncbi:MAG: metallophosphoesterase [Thaumarchaeota archaeon]|nr:metallophosphoesterase [Nitrososphaerota archaeon]